MAHYTITVTKSAAKDISKLSAPVQKRLKAKLVFFASQPDPLAFAKPLTSPSDGQYRWRIGDYRVVFDLDQTVIVILRIQHRREVYRR
jgi:mRNA interferase RelE/StbE